MGTPQPSRLSAAEAGGSGHCPQKRVEPPPSPGTLTTPTCSGPGLHRHPRGCPMAANLRPDGPGSLPCPRSVLTTDRDAWDEATSWQTSLCSPALQGSPTHPRLPNVTADAGLHSVPMCNFLLGLQARHHGCPMVVVSAQARSLHRNLPKRHLHASLSPSHNWGHCDLLLT